MKKKLAFWINETRVEEELTFEQMLAYDNNYCERVIKTFAKKAYNKVKNLHDNIMTIEDFYSEGLARAYYCYEMYDAEKSFVVYLQNGLEQLWLDYTKSIFAKKRRNTGDRVLEFVPSLEDEGLLIDAYESCEGTIESMEVNDDLEQAMAKLTDEERKIMEFLLNQETTKKIFAEELGMTRPTLDSRIEKVRDKMIDLLPEYMGIY